MARKRPWHALVKPSTVEFFEEGRRTPGYTLYDWVHGYVYGRWPYLYIGIGKGDHRLARVFAPLYSRLARLFSRRGDSKTGARVADIQPRDGRGTGTFADGYHGKVVPLRAASQLVTINEPVRITDLEKVIPYVKARDIILHNPDHILALECPCRASRPDPCLPLDVCLIVGDPFASFVEQHHPRRSRRITPQEAVEILRAEDARGHVHHAFFKDAMLGRFYAICNCCACCCGAMNAHQRGTPMLASSGYLCQVDDSLCVACEECVDNCQFGALSLGEMFAVVDEEKCMGCGVCASTCVEGALSLRREPGKGVPLEIRELVESFEAG